MDIITGKQATALKIVVYGPEGIGKSTFASKFPRPVFIDTEGSTKHMDVARTPRPTSWAMLMEQVRYFRDRPGEYETLVIDTVDWAEQLCSTAVCERAKKPGIEDFGYGKGYTYLYEEFGKLLNLLEEVTDRGVNVVVTAHAKMRKFEQPDEMGAYDRWELKLTGKAEKNISAMVKEWADMVLFANYKTHTVRTEDGKVKAQGGKRVMYTTHHPCWDAKNRQGLEDELPFDYSSIQACIPGERTAPTYPTPDSAPKPEPQPEKQPDPTANPSRVVDDESTAAAVALNGLMEQSGVELREVMAAVESRGYYPKGTPFENYDPAFVSGVLVGAWDQVYKMILDRRPIPF